MQTTSAQIQAPGLLREWSERTKTSLNTVAKDAGVSRATLTRYLGGRAVPVAFAFRVQAITAGFVRAEHWVG